MIKGLLTLIIGANTQPLDKALGRSGRKLKNFQRLAGGVTKVMGAFGGAFAIAAVIGDAARRVEQFDKSMINLSSILRVSRDDIKNLENQAIALGGATIFTAGQVGELQTVLARFGFSNNEIEGATKGILDLAAATRIDLEQAATVTAGTLRSFNLEATESGRVADVITNAMTKSALTVEDFNQGMVYAAPLANQLGISLEETAAAMAILANNNIKGSIAGTSLRRIFTELGKEGYSLSDIFKLNADQLKDVTDKLGFAKDATGQYALSSFLVLSENAGIIDQFTKKMSEIGSSTDVANAQLKSISNRIIILKSSWEGLILSIDQGEGVFSSAFKSIVDDSSKLLQVRRILNQGFDPKTGKIVQEESSFLKDYTAVFVELVKIATLWRAVVDGSDKIIAANDEYNKSLKESRKLLKELTEQNPDSYIFNPPSIFPEDTTIPALTPQQLAFMGKIQASKNEKSDADKEAFKKEQIRLEELYHKQLLEANKQREIEISLYDEATKSYSSYIQTRTDMAKAASKPIGGKDAQIGDDFLSDYDTPVPGGMFDPEAKNGPKIGLTPEELKEEEDKLLALADAYERMGQMIGNSLAQGAKDWQSYGAEVRNVVMDIIGAQIARGVSSLVANALETAAATGPFGLFLAPALGGLAAGLAKTAFNSAIPAFADGGIVSGPTLGIMGEYASASINPEVIAPLSDLKGMLGQGTGDINVGGEFVLRDRVLVAAVKREEKRMNRYGG